MFAGFCRRRIRASPPDCISSVLHFRAEKDAFSFRSCASSVCDNDSQNSFTVSYLIASCGMSLKAAMHASKKLSFKSPEKPDAALKILRDYGFKDAHITRIVTRWPCVLVACPKNNLLPKLDFFRSIGVPLPVLAEKLSVYPFVLTRSLKRSLIPSYNVLKRILKSDERVVCVFSRAPRTFGRCGVEGISSNISMLREKGVPESSVVWLVVHCPTLLIAAKERLAAYVDRAVEMGFDTSKILFVYAIRVFNDLSESTLKHKKEVYMRCGWSESDIMAAFLRYPLFMNLSEKNIVSTMDFLVNTFHWEPADIARYPLLINLSLEKRIKPRCLVAMILDQKGLWKKTTSHLNTLLKMTEEKFLERYIVKYEKEIPELLDIYQGKSSLPPSQISKAKNRAQDNKS